MGSAPTGSQASTPAVASAQPAISGPGNPVPDDLSPEAAAKIIVLKGEYSTHLVHMSY